MESRGRGLGRGGSRRLDHLFVALSLPSRHQPLTLLALGQGQIMPKHTRYPRPNRNIPGQSASHTLSSRRAGLNNSDFPTIERERVGCGWGAHRAGSGADGVLWGVDGMHAWICVGASQCRPRPHRVTRDRGGIRMRRSSGSGRLPPWWPPPKLVGIGGAWLHKPPLLARAS